MKTCSIAKAKTLDRKENKSTMLEVLCYYSAKENGQIFKVYIFGGTFLKLAVTF